MCLYYFNRNSLKKIDANIFIVIIVFKPIYNNFLMKMIKNVQSIFYNYKSFF